MTRRFDRLGWAMDHDDLTAAQKVVLIVLADAASEAEGLCWLKYATIAHRASLGLSTVRRAVDDLIDLELLRKWVRYDKRGRQTSNHYQLGCYESEAEGAQSEHPLGARSEQGEVPAASTSIVNQPEGAGLQNSRKTSSSSARRGRAVDNGPDQSDLDDLNRKLRPGTAPQPETRRVSPRRKPRQEHIHQPRSNKADGLACYWATRLEETGALPNRFEEQQIERSFRRWLEMGLDPGKAREMVDAFFADTSLAESEVPWSRFVANAERLRKRVTGRTAAKERVYEQDTSQRLADWAREALEETG